MQPPITIGLVEPLTWPRQATTTLLDQQADLQVVLNASQGQDLIEQLEQIKTLPNLILLELDMPVMDGFDTAQYVLKHYPDMKLVALASQDREACILRFMQLGAHGFLSKNTEPEEIFQALREVKRMGFYVNDYVASIVLRGLVHRKKVLPDFRGKVQLTNREMEVLLHICDGKSNRSTAEALNLGKRTVEGYRQSLMRKVGVKNVASLVAYAFREGLVS